MASWKLRKDSEIELIGNESEELPENQLPTIREVLTFFVYNTRVLHGVRKAAKITTERVLKIGSTTKVPFIHEVRVNAKLLRLCNEWRNFEKIKSARIRGVARGGGFGAEAPPKCLGALAPKPPGLEPYFFTIPKGKEGIVFFSTSCRSTTIWLSAQPGKWPPLLLDISSACVKKSWHRFK